MATGPVEAEDFPDRRSAHVVEGTEKPLTRPLKAYAFDPSRGRVLGNEMSLAVRYEDLAPGPVVEDYYRRDAIAIVDYDGANKVWYKPVDLDDPRILIRGGLDPSESDPRFHQQMVYAVVTDTIQQFEAALGRKIHWRRQDRDENSPPGALPGDIYTLNIYPHAMVSANAFYSPKAHGILFGYFRADSENPGRNLPGQTVFTCLSHDVVVPSSTEFGRTLPSGRTLTCPRSMRDSPMWLHCCGISHIERFCWTPFNGLVGSFTGISSRRTLQCH